jgi:hypothetical protein
MTSPTVYVYARPEERLSRGLWLVKWLLLIPHYIVLAVLWVVFVVLTLVAYIAILFTGRYPQGIFDFNLGVLRWSWRVGYYGYQVLGTDRYPPFTLQDAPDYPAGLRIDGPPHPRRWLPLVAWLFVIPHLVVISALTTAATWQIETSNGVSSASSLSVVGAAVLIIGVALLFTGRHLAGLYDLLMGVSRWTYRTIAYLALLTDEYPPFRLDQGPYNPEPTPTPPQTRYPTTVG